MQRSLHVRDEAEVTQELLPHIFSESNSPGTLINDLLLLQLVPSICNIKMEMPYETSALTALKA